MNGESPALEVRDLHTHFETASGPLRAVDGVSFSVRAGEIIGLVGESGSGKTVTGFSILGLVDSPGRIVSGSIRFRGRELVGLPEAALRKLRGDRIAMIFQDPMMSLNPVLRVGVQMIETVRAHYDIADDAAHEAALKALVRVGISAPEDRLAAYPHQLSGGMRQRVAIAIALLNSPDLIIADEPTTGLDVTIQAQILHEIQSLCRDTGTALMWITHDLAVVSGIADTVAVMYAGRIVEAGPVAALLDAPAHPYTRGLIDSVPSRNTRGTLLRQIPGAMPSLAGLPAGCAFRPRCGRADAACRIAPEDTVPAPGRRVRCHHAIVANGGAS